MRDDAGLILLFDLPFDRPESNPGYTKGCVLGGERTAPVYAQRNLGRDGCRRYGVNERAWALFSLFNPIAQGARPAVISN